MTAKLELSTVRVTLFLDEASNSNHLLPYYSTALDFTKTKVTGVFERGLPPPEPKYCVMTMRDEDFCRLTNHKFTLVQAVEAGKVKVRGDASIPAKINILFSTPTSRVKL